MRKWQMQQAKAKFAEVVKRAAAEGPQVVTYRGADTAVVLADRTIAIDADISEAWGRLTAKRPLPVIDGLLAATALVRGLTLVTRNVGNIADVGIGVVNPWNS